MKKNLLLYILLAFLIIVNVFFLFNYLGKSKKHKGQKGERKNYIVKKLDFNESQKLQFIQLDSSHQNRVRLISNTIRGFKDNLFDNISSTTFSEEDLDSITSLISEQEKLKDIEVFNHFRAIEAICDEEQKIKFKSIIKNALHRKGRRGSHSNKDNHRSPPPSEHH